MKTMNLFALAGTVLVIGSTLGCNKETDHSAATASVVPQAAQAVATQAAPGTNGQGMMQGQQGAPGASAEPAPGTSGAMTPGNGQMTEQMSSGCPMLVADAAVQVADIPKGIALTFTTAKGNVADLQSRVERMAQMYEMHQGQGSMVWHQMGNGHDGMSDGKSGPRTVGTGNSMAMGAGNSMAMGKGMGMADGTGHMGAAELMPDAKASVQRTDKGARMVLTPNDASQLDTLRQRVRIHQQRMQSGQCWVHQDQASTEAPQPTK